MIRHVLAPMLPVAEHAALSRTCTELLQPLSRELTPVVWRLCRDHPDLDEWYDKSGNAPGNPLVATLHWAAILTDRRAKGLADLAYPPKRQRDRALAALTGLPVSVAKRELDAWRARRFA